MGEPSTCWRALALKAWLTRAVVVVCYQHEPALEPAAKRPRVDVLDPAMPRAERIDALAPVAFA